MERLVAVGEREASPKSVDKLFASFAYSVCSSTMLVVNKLAILELPYPALLRYVLLACVGFFGSLGLAAARSFCSPLCLLGSHDTCR